jgi:UrcA family protein
MLRTLFIATTTSLTALPAYADDYTVSYDRSQFSNPEYVAGLYADIEEAARKACREEITPPVYRSYLSELRSCVEKTIAAAIAEIGSPELSAFAQQGLLAAAE